MTPSPRTSESINLRVLSEMEADIVSRQSKLDADRAKLKDKLAKLAQSYGVSTATALRSAPVAAKAKNGHAKVKGKTAKVAIRYRDPKNPENTWSGRGRPARWLAAYEKAGQKRESYRVGA